MIERKSMNQITKSSIDEEECSRAGMKNKTKVNGSRKSRKMLCLVNEPINGAGILHNERRVIF